MSLVTSATWPLSPFDFLTRPGGMRVALRINMNIILKYYEIHWDQDSVDFLAQEVPDNHDSWYTKAKNQAEWIKDIYIYPPPCPQGTKWSVRMSMNPCKKNTLNHVCENTRNIAKHCCV